jgi:hypothetical protein
MRVEKADVLRRLQEVGVFLIDTRVDPDDGTELSIRSMLLGMNVGGGEV